MATQKVNIQVSTTGAKKSKEKLSGLTGAISRVGKAAGIASAAYFGAKGLIGAFSTVIEAAGRQEQAEKALEVALGRTSTALLNQASALQSVTTAGDQAIIEQQAFLASLKFTEDQIKTILPVALDLSAATGISLESAVRNTSKTFSGLAGELGELVPQLRDLTTEEMKAGKAVEVLGKLFEGQASEQALTMSGALQQAQNSAGDLAEVLGEKLSPFVKTMAINFTQAAESLTGFIGAMPLSREEILNSLLMERSSLLTEQANKLQTVSDISSLFTEQALENNAIEKQTADIGLDLLDSQIKKFEDLLFVKKEEMEITKSSTDSVIDFGANIEKVTTSGKASYIELQKEKNKMSIQDLKNSVLSSQSASDAMKSVVRAEAMEAVAGLISSILRGVPFPFNIGLAAGAGVIASGLIDSGINSLSKLKFADGGIVPGYGNTDSVPAMLTPGEVILNASQQEGLVNQLNGINININGNVIGTTEFVRDTLVPEIQKAVRFA